jgi:hypothetical protein
LPPPLPRGPVPVPPQLARNRFGRVPARWLERLGQPGHPLVAVGLQDPPVSLGALQLRGVKAVVCLPEGAGAQPVPSCVTVSVNDVRVLLSDESVATTLGMVLAWEASYQYLTNTVAAVSQQYTRQLGQLMALVAKKLATSDFQRMMDEYNDRGLHMDRDVRSASRAGQPFGSLPAKPPRQMWRSDIGSGLLPSVVKPLAPTQALSERLRGAVEATLPSARGGGPDGAFGGQRTASSGVCVCARTRARACMGSGKRVCRVVGEQGGLPRKVHALE